MGNLVLIPLITAACHLLPHWVPVPGGRASGYDCSARSAVKHGTVRVDEALQEPDLTLTINKAFYRLAQNATAECGPSCRFFYGTIGNQCLAVAQSAQFTGLGSFMGRETTKAQAEATALRDCRDEVGQPGVECRIILSECPPGL